MKPGIIIRGLIGDHLIEHVGQGRWSIIHEPSNREIASVDGATTREARGNAEFAIGFLAAEELEAKREALAGAPRGGSRKDGPLLEGPTVERDILAVKADSPMIVQEIAEMCDRIGTAREDDPLWDDPEALMRRMGEAQLVTGGSNARIRTRGWQFLSALAAMAAREVEQAEEDREPSDSEIASVNPWVRANRGE